MHVMEDNDDARAVSSDCKVTKLTTDLHSVFATPKQTGLEDILLKVQEKNRHVSAAITSTDNQNETKDTGIAAGGDKGDSKVQSKQLSTDSAEAAEAVETAINTISSTTSSNSEDKMPTATAVEVSEKIADSSDDAVSVLSSSTSTKKSVTAITPTVNSSASTEAVEQKAKATEESTTHTTSKVGDAASPEESSSLEGLDRQESNSTVTAAQNSQKEDASYEKNGNSSSPTAIAEPTADDVMEGIDDFMEHPDSEGDEEKQNEKEFNDDLTFQMDVDPPVENSSSISNKEKNEESAIDLTSTSEQSKEKGEESSSSDAQLAASIPTAPTLAVTAAKTAHVDMHDKTVVTSTPVTNQKKSQAKRTDREQQEAASSSLEVKQEHEEESDGSEAQNLSKQKSSETRGGDNSAHPAQKAVQSEPSASRKRGRSVETEEDRQTGAGRADQDSEESVEPAKKLKLEVEANYQTHERVVNEYIETTQNTSVDEIQNHTDALVKEIQSLNDKIRETEIKWNNLLHLKKVKEEILLRLNRRKHVIGIMDTQLGEVSVYSHLDSSNLSSQHHHNQQGGRSSSVGPRPPTPPPEVEIRPASVTNSMHYGYNSSGSAATNGGDKAGNHFGNHSRISNRRSSSNSVQTSGNTSSKTRNAKDTNSFVSQFNSSNNAVTMVPLPNTTTMILNARANMNAVELAKEKSAAVQIQRQILSKPILSNHQQILNNLAMSAGLTGSSLSSGADSGANNSSTVGGSLDAMIQAQLQAALFANTNLLAGITSQGLLNGHHNAGGSNSAAANQQQLQIGRQGMRKDVSSIIADYRQKHPENVPRRGRRLKNVGGNSANNNGTSGGNSIGSFGEGGAISLTALSGGKSPANVRSNSTDSVANRISELLAAAETSRPSSNDSSQSSSNLLSSLMSASGAVNSSQQFFKDVLAQFAKMSQNEQSMLSNLQLLSSNATSGATNTVSSPQQSPQQQQQQHHQQHHHHQGGSLHQQQSSLLSKASLPEVTLHPVMNSTAHSDVLGGNVSHGNGSLTGANLSAVNSSTNSLLHGILTKSANRPGQTQSAAAAAAAAVGNFNSFSPTLARLLTVPERMNSQSSSTVTSGALANLQTNSLAGGLNLSKNINEISITPVVGSNYQQTLLAQQQQQQTLQRLREQQLYNLDDEADDSADRLVIDEGDDMGHRDSGGKRRGAEINENEVPQCQGCKKQEAKFVCAGCGNQWYCSRACQVNAWDDHSEVCSG
uniref:MYND-type domain-containing protein n=1 Tax=Anopheles culicifacies TaxID=139723 RepID=A0A182LX33_9DIPT